MTRLQVEVADFHRAASTLRHDVAESVRICLDGLSLPSAMVGEDPAGEAWSAAYDPAARTVLRATAQLSNAAAKTSLLFAHSGRNYALAEAASTSDGTAGGFEFGELLHAPPAVTAPSMPRSGGAGNGTPSGWWLVEHTVGFVWPGGHQDQLRAAAAEWRAAAGGIDNVSFDPVVAAAAFARDRLPEADDMATVCSGLTKRLEDLARSYRLLAEACDSYANQLDQCHTEVEDELTALIRDSAVTQGTGAALAFFTLGGSEIAAQGTQAGRIALTAARVSSLIEDLIRAGRRIATVLDRVHSIAQEINTAAGSLANLRLVYADLTKAHNGPRVPPPNRGGTGREAAAAGRLARGVRVKRPLNAREREHILDGNNGGGGHRWPGSEEHKPFPQDWDDERIIDHVNDILLSDETAWRINSGTGGVLTRRGEPAVWRAWEVREGVRIRVVWMPATGRVVSAYPDPDTPATGDLVR